MRKIFPLIVCLAGTSVFAFGASFSGTLLDEACFDRQTKELKDPARAADACEATNESRSFALNVSGKIYRLDSAGQTKVAAAMKSRADRTAPGAQLAALQATISGTQSGDMIKVDDVQIP